MDPRAGKITLTEWVNQWYPTLDLEPTTLSNYRYQIEVHVLPMFGNRALASITAEEVSAWERQIAASGYSRRTARDARSTLTTVLGDAIPRYIQANPAQRRRGKGGKGQRRIQRIEHAGKTWATPVQALLTAERCAALSGHDTDFVMIITVAYTGMRWSEVIGLGPEYLDDDRVDVSWKLYELNGRFYRGRPKDGSIRPAERMGHEVPGMRGVYSHVSDATRAELKAALQEHWTASLRERARLAPRSIVPVLDALLAEQGGSPNKIRSQIARKSDTGRSG